MEQSSSPLAAEIERVRGAYAALNQNDLDGFVRDFDADVERIEPGSHPTAGTFRGIDAVRAHVAQGRGTWAEGTCTPERFIVAGDNVVVFVRVHVRLKDKVDWIGGVTGDVFTFRDGKVIGFRTFWKFEEALAFAGVEDR